MDEAEVAQKLTKTKTWWNRNKGRILGTALAITSTYAVLMHRNKKQFDTFLARKDLLTEYYAPEYHEELQNKEQ